MSPASNDQRRTARVTTAGRHLRIDGRPFRVRGVTYGSFRRRGDGEPFPDPARVACDFDAMAGAGFNTVRTYTAPPPDVLDLAEASGLKLIVGIHYDDWRDAAHVTRQATRRVLDAGRRAVDEAMRRCGGRAGVLAVTVGNEIPSDVARVHGVGRVQETLGRLVADVHAADAGMLATYGNYPSTEYLDVPGQDLACFNIFLEDALALRRYLRHLQVVCGEVPLLVGELGLAAELHGADAQAAALAWQTRLVDESGCAGATVFSWTDEWAVGDVPVEGWGFGVTDADRRPKPGLAVVEEWATSALTRLREAWPTVSVVVCAYNEERRLRRCLESLAAVDYPDLDVVVCDDGSADRTLEIARGFRFRVLALPHRGLSAARNAGIAAARGEIVAFLDADAMCDPEWPYHLAIALEEDGVMAVGGPNLPVPGAGLVERAVALSPGNPVEVLVSDDRAEHVPGCNMAFRREALAAVGGFDPRYTSAGDDVDVCWKVLERGWAIGFAPSAQIFHHRRDSIRAFFRQQRGYGRAERLVLERHRHRVNRLGQARWQGFIYQGVRVLPNLFRPIVYYGPMGLAPFQKVVGRPAERLRDWIGAFLPLAVVTGVAGLALGAWMRWWLWLPAAVALLVAGYGVSVALSVRPAAGEAHPVRLRLLVAFLHVAQPVVRAWARTALRRPRPQHDPLPDHWTGDRLDWLRALERDLGVRRCAVRAGQPHDPWDLEASAGPLLRCRLTTAVVWNWLPSIRLVFSPRPLLFAVLAVGVALAGSRSGLGTALLGAVSGGAVLEFTVLKKRVDRVVAATTAASRAAGPE